MRTVQTIGIPDQPLGTEVDAVVVALKSRTIAAEDAVAQSLAALASWDSLAASLNAAANSPYPSASSCSTGLNRSAAEFMQ